MFLITLFKQDDLKDLYEITSTKYYVNKTKKMYHPEGLFSEKVFGPVVDYKCQCGLFNGKIYEGKVCPKCQVKIASSYERFTTYAKITLKLRCVHPDIIPFLSKEFGKTLIDDLIHGREFFKVENGVLVKTTKEDKDSGTGGEFLYNNISKLKIKDKALKKFLTEQKENIFIKYIPVIPPATRDIIVIDGYSVVDDLNNYYVHIIKRNEAIKRAAIIEKAMLTDYYNIQETIIELSKKLEGKIGKKYGLIRQNMLGKRADFSARAVIVPNPKLKLDEVELPLYICKSLYKFHIISYLINKKNIPIFEAFKKIDTMTDDEYMTILKEVMATSYVILNRQPTLHRLGMLSFKPIPDKNSQVLSIPALVCPPYNADFDGDQMAVYLPLSEAAIEETREKMLTPTQIISPYSRDITYKPGHDIVLGIYKITKFEPEEIPKMTIDESKTIEELFELDPSITVTYGIERTTVGRIIFNKILLERIPFVNKPINKKELYSLLKHKRLRNRLTEILNRIAHYGFYITTLWGGSFSVRDFVDPELLKEKEEIKNIFYMKRLEKLSKKMRTKFEKQDIYDMINSGARGNWDQVRQIALMKGFVTDVNGAVITEPIKHSLLEGLTPKEFFAASFGARKGVVDSSLNTAKSGYFTRKGVFAFSPCVIDRTLDDCGTDRYFTIKIEKDMLDHLVGRFVYDEELKKDVEIKDGEQHKYLDQIIKLRSPVYCKGENGFCKKCSGTFDRQTDQIGILAAQALGEPTTQMTLRTFHTGGIATTTLGDLLDSFIHKAITLKDKAIYVNYDCIIEQKGHIITITFTDKTLNPITFEATNDLDWKVKFNENIKAGTHIVSLRLKNADIVSDLNKITKLLDNKETLSEYTFEGIIKLFITLKSIFSNYGNIDFLFYEVVISQMAYMNGEQLRFSQYVYPNELKTLSEIPMASSIVQGLAFEGFRKVVHKSLDKLKNKELSKNKTKSILERIIMLDF